MRENMQWEMEERYKTANQKRVDKASAISKEYLKWHKNMRNSEKRQRNEIK